MVVLLHSLPMRSRLSRFAPTFRVGAAILLDLVLFSTLLGPYGDLRRPNTPVLGLAAIGLVLAAILCFRDQRPHQVLAAVAAVSLTGALGSTYRPVLATCLALHRSAELRWSRLQTALAAVGGVVLVSAWVLNDDRSRPATAGPAPLGLSVFTAAAFIVLLLAAYGLGRLRRTHRLRIVTLESSMDAAHREAITSERERIGRELHDIVSNAIAVMTLSAGATSRIVDSPSVLGHMAIIQKTGAQASDELHRLLRTMRTDPVPEDPPPGYQREGASLLQDMRGLGLRIAVVESGEHAELDDSVDRTLFRTLQEALTNCVKYADMTEPIRCAIDWGTEAVTVRIVSTTSLRRPDQNQSSHGLGLIGLHERVSLVGGTCEIGRDEHTFVLDARLPVRQSSIPTLR